jgi:hypothetical protein
MTATAALTAVHSTATFGLPPEAAHLIAKLRNLSPELLAAITRPKQEVTP